MAGRGFFDEACPIDSSRIYTLRNGRWQKMFRLINPDRSFSGVSLAESFAEKYAKEHDVDVGLICCADGGTCIDQWMADNSLSYSGQYKAFRHFTCITPESRIRPLEFTNCGYEMYRFPKMNSTFPEGCLVENPDVQKALVLVNPSEEKVQLQYERWYIEMLPNTVATVVFED